MVGFDFAAEAYSGLLGNGKIRLKLMKYDSKRGIIRVDHKLAKQAREIMNRNDTEMKIQTVRTSGTLKGLEKE